MTRSQRRKAVVRRAGRRCEYCQMHQSLQGGRFHVDHIIPTSLGGSEDLENLAFACISCNLAKCDRIALPDPDTGRSQPIFNPRKDLWSNHMQFDGYRIRGVTARGHALIKAFRLNSVRRVRIRKAEGRFGYFPP